VQLFIRDVKLTEIGLPLQLIATEPGLEAPPATSIATPWYFDTGYNGDAFAWRAHIVDAGLDPDEHRDFRVSRLTTSLIGQTVALPIRKADLWLVGDPLSRPYPLRLRHGITFRDESVPSESKRAARQIVGLRLFLDAELKIEIDFKRQVFSVWTPKIDVASPSA